MGAHSRTPISVVCCTRMVRIAAVLIPRAQREAWTQEWRAEIWHRWQFLLHAGAWGPEEAFRLFRDCAGAFTDAGWHFISRKKVRNGAREAAQSPWTCLGALSGLLLIVAILSSGFPATRQLLTFPSENSGRLLFISLHPVIGGVDRGLPPDVVPAWSMHSRMLASAARFEISRAQLTWPETTGTKPLVIVTDRRLFDTLQARPVLGSVPKDSAIVLDHRTWMSVFHGNPKVIGSHAQIDGQWFRITGVLPAKFYFVTRRPAVYLLDEPMMHRSVMVVARARGKAPAKNIERELARIAEESSYYFFSSQLRLRFFDAMLFAPVGSFGLAVLVSALLAISLCGVRMRYVRLALKAENRRAAGRRAFFFLAKLCLALAALFVAGLEWSRSESSLMFASRDPGSGPVLLWLYIAGAMGIFFWCVADQRARCRVCLRWLCFPVRIGCPGCLLLDWSGTELLCTEGHGILHVPLLAPSWDEESEHWIALDESWHGLFAQTEDS